MDSGNGRTIACLLLGACALLAGLFLLPFDSDGAFANYDGFWYALSAERNGAQSIVAHHILFHVLVLGLLQPLEALGVPTPGATACRIVSGLGAALVLVFVASRARGRWLVGLGFGLALFSFRSFIEEAATGDNVLPACAAALATLILATRPSPDVWKVAAAFAVSLLFRQDNLLLLPAVVLAMLSGRREPARVAAALAVGGAVAAACTVAAWLVARKSGESLLDWVLYLGRRDWKVAVAGHPLLAHADAFGIAAVGRHWRPDHHQLWIGAAVLAALGCAGLCLRGTDPARAFPRACAIVIAFRIPFFLWFEAHNPEWHVLNWALVAASCASLTAGAPATSRAVRVLGSVLLLAVPVGVLLSHGTHTWRLRERNLVEAVRLLGKPGPEEVFVRGHRVGSAFDLLGVRATVLEGTQPEVHRYLWNRLESLRAPMLFVTDRFVLDGMPHSLDNLNEYDQELDLLNDTEDLRVSRWQGRVYAVRYVPRADSGPTRRSR